MLQFERATSCGGGESLDAGLYGGFQVRGSASLRSIAETPAPMLCTSCCRCFTHVGLSSPFYRITWYIQLLLLRPGSAECTGINASGARRPGPVSVPQVRR